MNATVTTAETAARARRVGSLLEAAAALIGMVSVEGPADHSFAEDIAALNRQILKLHRRCQGLHVESLPSEPALPGPGLSQWLRTHLCLCSAGQGSRCAACCTADQLESRQTVRTVLDTCAPASPRT